jgi:hypothetical protein
MLHLSRIACWRGLALAALGCLVTSSQAQTIDSLPDVSLRYSSAVGAYWVEVPESSSKAGTTVYLRSVKKGVILVSAKVAAGINNRSSGVAAVGIEVAWQLGRSGPRKVCTVDQDVVNPVTLVTLTTSGTCFIAIDSDGDYLITLRPFSVGGITSLTHAATFALIAQK